jgi:phage terminase large subunit-like protein
VTLASAGVQTPRITSTPDYGSSSGQEAIELAAMAGLLLDPWQQLVLEHGLGERADGSWSAFEVGVNVARQNGKGGILEARELAGLFLLGEDLIIHSAHQFDTSMEAFLRMEALIEGCSDLSRRVKSSSRSHGSEGFTLTNGQRLRYRTRTKGGGRGFTCNCLMLDEAMFLSEAAHGALLPTLSAIENPQVWYTGSAVDQQIHEDGIVFARVRERGVAGDPRLAYFEWSADAESPGDLTVAQIGDEALWAQANPGLGIRIDHEHVANEERSMDARTFAVERLGVGDWPRTDGTADAVIEVEAWDQLADPASSIASPAVFAFDISPDRSTASIAVAGVREDGLTHVEIVDRRRGSSWIPDRLVELVERHETNLVVCDGFGPAASMVHQLEGLAVPVETTNSRDLANACGMLFDMVAEKRLRHLGQPELHTAVKNATRRALGDSWAWSRRNSQVDISPLVAVTLAAFTASTSSDWDPDMTYIL